MASINLLVIEDMIPIGVAVEETSTETLRVLERMLQDRYLSLQAVRYQ